jgi:uncharacterized protein YutE (UPF0331/DUF86 family)
MSPLDADVIRRKLAVIVRNLRDLATVEQLSLDDYRADRFRLKGSERLLQELIEAAVDANLHLLRSAGEPTPPDYFLTFIALGRLGVISRELAERLAPAAGLRNRLVHEYDEIDDRIVLKAVGEARRDFAAYAAAVEEYLEAEV